MGGKKADEELKETRMKGKGKKDGTMNDGGQRRDVREHV